MSINAQMTATFGNALHVLSTYSHTTHRYDKDFSLGRLTKGKARRSERAKAQALGSAPLVGWSPSFEW